MRHWPVKTAGMVLAASVLAFTQLSCGTEKTEEPVSQTAEAPEISASEAAREESGETAGPSLPGVSETPEAEVSETAKPPQETGEVSPSPEQEGAAEGEGTLSPPSESAPDSVFGQPETSEPTTDQKMQTLLSGLAFPAGNGTWSAYVCNLAENTDGAVNPQRQQAASLIKLFIMGAVYENYDALVSQYGQGSVDGNLHSMITVSDNDAANALVSYLGGGDGTAGMNIVNQYCSANGYSSTHMGRLLLQSNEFDDNYTSVIDCGYFLKRVYEGNKEGDPVAAAEFSLLAEQTRRNKIPAQMPEGVSVANKTGELADVENDAGIIYNVQNDLIVVFMSENVTEAGSAQSTIASLSRQVYDYYNGPAAESGGGGAVA